MTITVYLPFLVAAMVGLAGPLLTRRTRPTLASWVACGLATAAAAGTTWALGLLAITGLDDVPGRRLTTVAMPVPDPVAVLAAAALGVAALRAGVVLHRRLRVLRRIRAALAGLPAGGDDVVVLSEPRPDAFALPGGWRRRRQPARIVVTDGMLAALSRDHQRVLIAHERAHLRGGHHWLRLVTDLSAAVNPMVTPMRRITGYLCERSADEHAAAEAGDRGIVARSIALAALARSGRLAPDVAGLAFHHLGTVDRIAALQEPAPEPSRRWTWAALAVGAIVAADANATGELVEVLRHLV